MILVLHRFEFSINESMCEDFDIPDYIASRIFNMLILDMHLQDIAQYQL